MAYMMTKSAKLTNLFEQPVEYAGYRMLDPAGQRAGKVKVLYANANGEPEYAGVKVGSFDLESVLLPVEALSVVGKRRALVLM